MRRKILLSLLVLVFTVAGATISAAQPATQSATPLPVTIPFELVARHIMVKVRINNSRPLSFVFDTGDKVGIVDTEVAKELNLGLEGQVRVGGAGADTMLGSYVKGASWSLPELAGFSQPVTMSLPLARMAARFGHDFDGIMARTSSSNMWLKSIIKTAS
jgi:hypothetical protein